LIEPALSRHAASICCPCARDGAELQALIEAWQAKDWRHSLDRVVAVEIDRAKGATLRKRFADGRHQVLVGDAFATTWETRRSRGASVLYLRPPEASSHRFLIRYTSALAVGGGLLYVIPQRELGAAVDWLAAWYKDIRAYALDGALLAIVARRRADRDSTSAAAEELQALARDPARIPPIPEEPDPLVIPAGDYSLALTPSVVDRIALLGEFRPWQGVLGMDRSLADLSRSRVFPTALPPKPAHMALALASGQFDGRRLDPDDPSTGLPPILVKAIFCREEVQAGEKLGPDGELKSRTTVERPSFRMAILRLDTFEFVEPAHGAALTGTVDLGTATVRDILELYGRGFASLMESQFPPLHNPAEPEHLIRLPDLERRPLRCQEPAIMAALKLVASGANVIFSSSVGTGKSTMALYVWQALTARYREDTVAELQRVGFPRPKLPPPVRRLLIVCPPHLVEEWEEQIRGAGTLAPIAAEARIQVVKTIADLHRPADVYLMSHSAAKLGSRKRGVGDGGNAHLDARRLPA
jgi:hypothetical protein